MPTQPTNQVFVICSKYPPKGKCDGPGVAEYGPDFVQYVPVDEHFCGFCEAPMRVATDKEIAVYYQNHPEQRPVIEIEEVK